MRNVGGKVGVSAMAIYKYFPNRDALLRAATETENQRIAAYFRRANCRTGAKGLDGMLGYLDYAFDHPRLFEYMFSSQRDDAVAFPKALLPSLKLLHEAVVRAILQGSLKPDDSMEVTMAIWACAHGLVSLYLAGRIRMSGTRFRRLYVRSLDRLLQGLAMRRDRDSRQPTNKLVSPRGGGHLPSKPSSGPPPTRGA